MNEINGVIDQTLLRPDATGNDIKFFLKDVTEYKFYAAVVNPCWVPTAVAILPKSIRVCSVVGFPLGASSTKTKVHAAQDLIQMGCDEIDMVMNIGRLKEKDFKYVGKELKLVRELCEGKVLKVIIEACLLVREEKIAAANIIKESGAHFVKTSTGFSKGGATVEDVELLRAVAGNDLGVKASGGIRTYEQAVRLIRAGANRLGTSQGVSIAGGAPV
jgi:deoxyribose-phosphate aldolase